MILFWLIVILMAGSFLAWLSSRWSSVAPKWIALVAVLIDFLAAASFWIKIASFNYPAAGNTLIAGNKGLWFTELNWMWIPSFGISFHLASDGLSLLLVMLTLFIGVLSVLISWNEIQYKVGFFYFNLLWILAGIIGVFTAIDLFLFYFFWEVMLIPMYFLIGIWGSKNRIYASFKFFIFTQSSGLLMFLSILGLFFLHGKATGVYTFDYMQLIGTKMAPNVAMWLMAGFVIAFIVKLPAVPFHNWLPDAHTEAPTAGSVILAALMLKTGAYGLIRFVLPLFPDAARTFAPAAMILGAIGIIYGAVLAFAQTDFKRLVAYTSVNHMGFVLLGVFALNEMALQGVVMQMLCHGISTGALFIIVGALYGRIHTRDIEQMGGLWDKVPRMGSMAMVFALASLGLPGLGNFIAEFLVLAGAYQASNWTTAISTIGLVLSTMYSLRIMAKVFLGKPRKTWTLEDLNLREMIVMGSLTIVILWLGLFPNHVLYVSRASIQSVVNTVNASSTAAGQANTLLQDLPLDKTEKKNDDISLKQKDRQKEQIKIEEQIKTEEQLRTEQQIKAEEPIKTEEYMKSEEHTKGGIRQ
ncbi:MAG: NADH-quinone oxidoreductase subunit M [Bacteroidota bacterium]|nr:NADH-quinone oxidoreductase subunit M [Bacteroidota bacterium]